MLCSAPSGRKGHDHKSYPGADCTFDRRLVGGRPRRRACGRLLPGQDGDARRQQRPGGGYDTVSRTIARYIGKHIPGNPNVVVKNMPGAGGIVAANHLYNAAEKDGTVFACVRTTCRSSRSTAPSRLVRRKQVQLARIAEHGGRDHHGLAHDAGELDRGRQELRLKLGSFGANSTPSFYGRLATEALGVKIKLVVGYPGQNEARWRSSGARSTAIRAHSTTR